MFKVGMKALVIGARTESGSKWIGSEVQIHQLVSKGDVIDPSVISYPAEVKCGVDSGAVVYREGIGGGEFAADFTMFATKHLMPIPPLEDPGIDECTFTPIVQKEVV